MELLYFFGLLMIVAKSDAAVTFTVPASPTAACPTIGSAAEGTKTGTVVTPAATPATGVTYTIVGTDAAQFDIDSGTGVVTIKSSATLDYETKDSYTVEIVGNDGADTSATCTIAITDVEPWFSTFASTIIVSDQATSGTLTTLICTDGATASNTLAMTGGDDSGTGAGAAKFGFDAASGALSKTGVVLDATTKASYLLTFTCVEGAHTATTTVTICVNSDSNCPSSSKASINSGVLAGLIVPALLAIYRLS